MGDEVFDMGRILGMFTLIKLAGIERIDEQTQSAHQCIRAARKAARGTCQPSEVMTQF